VGAYPSDVGRSEVTTPRERPIIFSGPMVRVILSGRKTQTRRVVKCRGGLDALAMHQYGRCPYGVPGDRLWVRETWGRYNVAPPGVLYRADEAPRPCGDPERWRPSIFMRRADSRITLEVTAVRVERLNSISEEDARAEGASWSPNQSEQYPDGLALQPANAAFRCMWDSINGKRASWASNPFVWVVEFRRVQ
jgi:hypothetical protein